jgi:hypothetical protein
MLFLLRAFFLTVVRGVVVNLAILIVDGFLLIAETTLLDGLPDGLCVLGHAVLLTRLPTPLRLLSCFYLQNRVNVPRVEPPGLSLSLWCFFFLQDFLNFFLLLWIDLEYNLLVLVWILISSGLSLKVSLFWGALLGAGGAFF